MRNKSHALAGVAGLSVAAMLLVGCSSDTGDNNTDADNGSSSGQETALEFGASKEEWIAAFEDVDEIQLRTQSSVAKGTASGADFEGFLAEIEEWSGGKITWDVGYSSGYAAPTEAIDALNDGRLDLNHVIPQYFAEELPLAASLVNMNVVSNASSVLGAISSNVWPVQAGFESDELLSESADLGLVPLVPYWNTGAGALICAEEKTSAADLRGAVVAASGALQQKQVSALGGSPTAMPFTEFYEALQRGAVDCVQTTGTSALGVGLAEVAPHVVIDPEASFIGGAAMLSFSKQTWDSLPDLAQQLIWERSSTFIAGNIKKVIDNYFVFNEDLAANGGGIYNFEDDARTAMQEGRPAILEEIGKVASEDFIANAEKLSDEWLEKTKAAGFDVEVPFADLDTWLEENDEAIDEFIQNDVAATIYSSDRP